MSKIKVPKAVYAFPFVVEGDVMCPGMTLRDWFAGQALTGLAWRYDENVHYDDLASDAFKLADAMLAAREQKA